MLKYIGDAVLAFFVVDTTNTKDSYDDENKPTTVSSSNDNFDSLSYTNVISCAYTMIKVIQEGINPILNQNDYPDLKVRIGIEFGEIAVVMYGVDMMNIRIRY